MAAVGGAEGGAPKGAPDTSVHDRDRLRLALFAVNADVWTAEPSAPHASLDASLKRNSTFIKRLRQGNIADVKEQLLRDVDVLNLGKYLDELVPSLPELLWRSTTVKDRLAAVELISVLHRRFGAQAFTIPMSDAIAAQFLHTTPKPPTESAEQREKDEAARIARQRILLRGATELALAGVAGPGLTDVRTESVQSMSQGWLFGIMRHLVGDCTYQLATDRDHVNTSILVHVLKLFGPSLLASVPEHDAGAVVEPLDSARSALVPPAAQARFRKLFETYYTTLVKHIQRDHTQLGEQEARNTDAYIRSGEVFEDRQQTFERRTKELEKLVDASKALAELLSVRLPALADTNKADGARVGVHLDTKSSLAAMSAKIEQELASGQSPWDDEETRFFYTNLNDLAEMVPASLLKEAGSEPPPDTDADVDATETGTKSAQVQTLLARLPTLASREMIDEAAVELAFLNTRSTRTRLVRSVLGVPRDRRDLLPYYARLVATVAPYMPDVLQGVLTGLGTEFRMLHHRKSNDTGTALARARNATFLGELIKFGIVPEHTIFFTLKTLVDEFGTGSIEVLALLLETCGRYLVRTPATAERMHEFLQLLQRKRQAHHLDARLVLLLDNAYYQCVPPPRAVMEQKPLSDMQQYIHHLFQRVLSRSSVDRVTHTLRRLDWGDSEVQEALHERFTAVWEVNYNMIFLLAKVMRTLYPAHTTFFVTVLDAVCEQIQLDMESNAFPLHQRRIAMVQYLGELYNYRMVDSHAIFDHLWLLCMDKSPDAASDYFRIRLVCTLLRTCGACFDSGLARRRMDEFLVAFRVYVQRKAQPLPTDIAYMLRQTIETLRPKLVWRDGEEEETTRKLETILPFYWRRTLPHLAAGAAEADESDEESDASSSNSSRGPRRPASGQSKDDAHSITESELEEHERRHQEALDREAEDELDAELAQLMAEGASGSAAPATAVPPPQQSAFLAPRILTENQSEHMVFSLLTRRGHRAQAQEVHVPLDAALAVHTRQQLEAEEKERKQLKAYVLAYRDREE